ncbi:hypothetical protein GCM10010468_65300 [Actinocorallia longicatena]|uniref:Secreted protein n=1 Tax=Actinocorallia longicatena TaxID=111803 RepID=A0ABP6QIB6_9ACTN
MKGWVLVLMRAFHKVSAGDFCRPASVYSASVMAVVRGVGHGWELTEGQGVVAPVFGSFVESEHRNTWGGCVGLRGRSAGARGTGTRENAGGWRFGVGVGFSGCSGGWWGRLGAWLM